LTATPTAAPARPPDRVMGTGFTLRCRVGFLPIEAEVLQTLSLDFEAETDWRAAAAADAPDGLVDYAEVYRALRAHICPRRYKLIERVAEEAAAVILGGFPVDRVRVRVTKRPLDMPEVGAVAVECWRTRAELGLA